MKNFRIPLKVQIPFLAIAGCGQIIGQIFFSAIAIGLLIFIWFLHQLPVDNTKTDTAKRMLLFIAGLVIMFFIFTLIASSILVKPNGLIDGYALAMTLLALVMMFLVPAYKILVDEYIPLVDSMEK